jgi:HK97 family phage prohead protease
LVLKFLFVALTRQYKFTNFWIIQEKNFLSDMFKSGINIIKDIDTEKKTVVFAFSKFDTYDSDDDLTEKTAFDKTIKESGPDGSDRIKHVWGHNAKELPIGKIQRMWRDQNFAYAESKMLNNQKALDTWDAYLNKAVDEHSYFGKSYNTGVNQKGGKLIKEVKLFEVSTVLFGAQELAKVVQIVKSGDAPEPWLLDHITSLQSYVKKSNASDDFLEVLEIELEKAMDILNSLEKSGREITPAQSEPITEISLADIYKLKRHI